MVEGYGYHYPTSKLSPPSYQPYWSACHAPTLQTICQRRPRIQTERHVMPKTSERPTHEGYNQSNTKGTKRRVVGTRFEQGGLNSTLQPGTATRNDECLGGGNANSSTVCNSVIKRATQWRLQLCASKSISRSQMLWLEQNYNSSSPYCKTTMLIDTRRRTPSAANGYCSSRARASAISQLSLDSYTTSSNSRTNGIHRRRRTITHAKMTPVLPQFNPWLDSSIPRQTVSVTKL